MVIEFENCTEISVPEAKFNFETEKASGDLSELIMIHSGELVIPNYKSIEGWEKLVQERTITNLYSDNKTYSIPYEDEEEGVLGTYNKGEKVAVFGNDIIITFV